MTEPIDHGPRLSGADYDRRVADLYLELPNSPSAEEEIEARRQEFSLRIDHRLGIHFPEDRREALWEVNEHLQRRPLRMLLASQIAKVFPRFLAGAARRLGASVLAEYGRVLTPQELVLFFGEEETSSPGLPFEPS